MDSSQTDESASTQPVVFTTQTTYLLPAQKFMIPTTWKRYQLSQLVNKALSLTNPVPFDFLVRGEILRGTLAEWCHEKGVGEEETLEVEYIESVMPPQKMSSIPQDDWVSDISCTLPGHFVTASYDGYVRIFDYSQNAVFTGSVHDAPVTSLSVDPTSTSEGKSLMIATASHDLTGRLVRVSLELDTGERTSSILASLHLHTSPLSDIAYSRSGEYLLTASWDTLIGLWDSRIPEEDEIDVVDVQTDRRKRRKVDGRDRELRPKRKVPSSVLKSHTARVSKAAFSSTGKSAFSCGFDSTVRSWDLENGVCTNTITASEKPMVGMAVLPDDNSVVVSSADRSVSVYDFRAAPTSLSSATLSFMHSSLPSSVALSPTSDSQIVTGSYDGVIRLWDLRSTKSAVASFKVWDGEKKVLAIDTTHGSGSGIVGVGGEGGLEVWRVGKTATTTAV